MRPLFFLLILAFVGCAKNDRVLSLADISRPTREMLDAEVRVRGFIFFHVEETLLCPKNEYGSAPFIQLSLLPSMRPAPDKEKNFVRGFDGREVVVRGVLRVGPFGVLGRPMVYVEVSDIEKG